MKIYVASSWRNQHQPAVVERLQRECFEVYDFRHPAPGDDGFHWSEIDPNWQTWSPEQFREALCHRIAQAGFAKDMTGLEHCHACVLVLPAGRSAHLEAGWATGNGKFVAILDPEPAEPELMYLMASSICTSIDELIRVLTVNHRRIVAGWGSNEVAGPGGVVR